MSNIQHNIHLAHILHLYLIFNLSYTEPHDDLGLLKPPQESIESEQLNKAPPTIQN